MFPNLLLGLTEVQRTTRNSFYLPEVPEPEAEEVGQVLPASKVQPAQHFSLKRLGNYLGGVPSRLLSILR